MATDIISAPSLVKEEDPLGAVPWVWWWWWWSVVPMVVAVVTDATLSKVSLPVVSLSTVPSYKSGGGTGGSGSGDDSGSMEFGCSVCGCECGFGWVVVVVGSWMSIFMVV